jgi:hypothetical protein
VNGFPSGTTGKAGSHIGKLVVTNESFSVYEKGGGIENTEFPTSPINPSNPLPTIA